MASAMAVFFIEIVKRKIILIVIFERGFWGFAKHSNFYGWLQRKLHDPPTVEAVLPETCRVRSWS